MRYLILSAMLFAIAVTGASAYAAESYVPGRSFIAICYHNIEDKNPDQTFEGSATDKLIAQLSWLKSEGYQAVSIDDLLLAQKGRKPLPPKAMLLTFDDGYESFYTRVYPLLRVFHFPAVVAVVDQWMQGQTGDRYQPGDQVRYGNIVVPRGVFLTWPQVREMQKSGLVEVASHSHALHYGLRANPLGNEEPAATTAGYDPKTRIYETPEFYKKRLAADTGKSVQTIMKETGKRPRVTVWPYGAYNQISIAINRRYGLPVNITLADGFATVERLSEMPRYLVDKNPDLGDFAIDVRYLATPIPIRAVQVDLDYIYDPDPEQLARNLDAFIARIYNLKIDTVFLQAFADSEGSGLARQVYFPNRYLPVRADLFNRVVWQLKTRAAVRVYGWLPVLSFDFGPATPQVMAWDMEKREAGRDDKAPHRVSPFDAGARKKILGLYEDMARQAPIDGILFHDDAALSDFEDASTPALKAYRRAKLPPSIDVLRSDPTAMKKWTEFKTDTLITFTRELADRARLYRSPLKTARNIYAPPVQNPDSEEWFAQNYDKFLKNYDYTVIEAMPYMENVPGDEAKDWLQSLIAAVRQRANGFERTIFELQSVDWRKDGKGEDRAIPAEILGDQMDLLARNGAMNFGYYPDDFVTDTPTAGVLHKHLSLQAYPYMP